ncbi:MAG: DEAD/DEAH box helicase, partial [Propionibacteriaceae bacterium]|nr:DEAD/DEAH box helicase [Propionibacteriaceae bacterium]
MWQTEAFRAQATKLETVAGVRTAEQFWPMRVRTVGEAARLMPRRYLRGAEDSHLRDLRVGEAAAFLADIVSFNKHHNRCTATVSDGTASVTMTFFIPPRAVKWFPGLLESRLVPGRRGLFVGKVGEFNGRLQLTHPDFVILDDDGVIIGGAKKNVEMAALASKSGLIGIYPATSKLPTWTVASTIRLVLDHLGAIPDPLPEEVVHGIDVTALARADHAIDHEPPPGTVLPDLATALNQVHRPESLAEAWLGRQRLLFDEAFGVLATMAYRRRLARAQPATPRTPAAGGLLEAFDDRLPFELTPGQRAVGEEILADLARDYPMQRLLQGEVGSGKTLVALRAMLTVVDSGGQAVLLAPTEVLAQQHYRTIVNQLGDLAGGAGLFAADRATEVVLFTGSMTAAEKRRVLLRIASGEAGIVIGTHALFSSNVSFADLGLVVIDEQHRFGVEQRAVLNEKADTRPHVLVMTATPIPRTVAMTAFGDLEVSTLREIPAGRSEVTTNVVAEKFTPQWVDRAWARVVEEVAAGRQVFIVCPQITATDTSAEAAKPLDQESEVIVPRNVTDLHAELTEGPLKSVRVAALHGQLSTEIKDEVMRDFANGDL